MLHGSTVPSSLFMGPERVVCPSTTTTTTASSLSMRGNNECVIWLRHVYVQALSSLSVWGHTAQLPPDTVIHGVTVPAALLHVPVQFPDDDALPRHHHNEQPVQTRGACKIHPGALNPDSLEPMSENLHFQTLSRSKTYQTEHVA